MIAVSCDSVKQNLEVGTKQAKPLAHSSARRCPYQYTNLYVYYIVCVFIYKCLHVRCVLGPYTTDNPNLVPRLWHHLHDNRYKRGLPVKMLYRLADTNIIYMYIHITMNWMFREIRVVSTVPFHFSSKVSSVGLRPIELVRNRFFFTHETQLFNILIPKDIY